MLKHPYISIQCEDGSVSYGGNQSWLPTPEERSFGCGFIAAADILRRSLAFAGFGTSRRSHACFPG